MAECYYPIDYAGSDYSQLLARGALVGRVLIRGQRAMLTLDDCDQLFPLLAREANVRSSQLLHRLGIGLNAERNQDHDRKLIWATSARALTWPMFAAVMTRVNLLPMPFKVPKK